MDYKKSIIVLLLAIFLFSITGVCASEIDTPIASDDTNQIKLSDSDKVIEDNVQTSEKNSILAQTNNVETLNAENDTEILHANEGTYSDLSHDIHQNGGVLTKSYYRYHEDDGLTIVINEDDFTVEGNGAVIDMGSTYMRTFDVESSGVTFKNLTIINARYDGGAAIYFESSGIVENCNFTNNTATGPASFGGAVYFHDTGAVSNCNFIANTATGSSSGGAVYFYKSGTVSNCNFTANTGTGYGGAVNINGEGTVSNCNFNNNTAGTGGAAQIDSGSVENCNFAGNTAVGNNNTFSHAAAGGAINMNSGNVSNCNFTGNTATGNDSWSGAININYEGNVRNCSFTNNTAESCGAINIDSGIVENCNFTDNQAATFCGAVYLYNSGTVTNCNFIANTANDHGGAIYFAREGNASNCNFIGNTANGTDSWGGAILIESGIVENCNFTDNHATGSNSKGGAVYVGIDGATVSNCNFTGNTANAGGAVYFLDTGNVSNCNFTGNTANAGGAVYFLDTGNVSNCNFTDNHVTGKDSRGGAVYIDMGSVENCNFTDNKVTGNRSRGGAVCIYDSGDVRNCNFIGNTVTGNESMGGAINILSGNVTDCNFIGNTITGNDSVGGAVYMLSGNVTDCNFAGNTATNSGGAVHFSDSGDVSNCNFTNNTAYDGGAVYFDSNGNVTNSNFTNNTAYDGGAVYFNSNGNVTNSNFTGNTASNSSGAVLMGSGSVENSNFADNSAKVDGGAVRMDSGSVKNSNFSDNSAKVEGGAVSFRNSGDVRNCNFAGNTGYDGGAVCMSSGNVTDCNFTGNTATSRGGAVYFDINGIVSNCNFAANTAILWGGAVYFNSTGDVANCNFTDNSAVYGSAIYFWSRSAPHTVSNSRFLNNRADADEFQVTKNDNNITILFKGNDNLLNAIYSNSDVSFNNVTYWGANGIHNTGNYETKPSRSNNEAGQNITVLIVVDGTLVLNDVVVTDENGMIVLPVKIETENYYIRVRHDKDSYYTEAEKTVSDNMKLYANVTSITTDNKTVNITAKSNILNEVMPGNLLFILPNGDEINASYAGNGIWWAEHTFEDYGVYQVNATYVGLDNVTVSNATINITKNNITKTDSKIILNDIVLNYGESKNVTVTVEGATGITAKIDGNDVGVVGNLTIPISGLNIGNHILSVTTIADANHTSVTKGVTITVNKVPTEIILANNTADLKVGDKFNIVVTTHPDALNVTYIPDTSGVVSVDNNGVVTALKGGTGIVTVKVGGFGVYAENSTTVTVIVHKFPTEMASSAVSLVYNADKYLIVNLTDAQGNPIAGVNLAVDLNGIKNYKTDKNGQIKVSLKDLYPNSYNSKITFAGNDIYGGCNDTVKVVVKKATPKITAKAKTFKTTTVFKVYSMTLKDNKGKAIRNATVYLKVGGKTYKTTTNSKGKANLLFTKLKKKGTYNATITYKGNKCYNSATKKVTIKVESGWKTISKGSKNSAIVKKIQRALKNHGYYLKHNGHYLMLDSIFQYFTQLAVKKFQKDNSLKVTGKVDEKTAKKLGLIK